MKSAHIIAILLSLTISSMSCAAQIDKTFCSIVYGLNLSEVTLIGESKTPKDAIEKVRLLDGSLVNTHQGGSADFDVDACNRIPERHLKKSMKLFHPI